MFLKEISWTWTNPNTKRKFEFMLVQEEVNWFQAKDACAGRGGRLAQPDSQEKNENIRSKISSIQFSHFWFGARKVSNNQWQYTNGSTLIFSDWASGKGISISDAYLFK